VIENKFVVAELDHRIWIDIGGGSIRLDPGDGVFLSFYRSPENSAVEAGAAFLFTSTPMPLLRKMAAAVSSARTDTGRITTIGRQTKYCHFNRNTPQVSAFHHYRKLSARLWRGLLAGVVPPL
jgi:hypothetical protein